MFYNSSDITSPRKNEAEAQCRAGVGPSSTTLSQRQPNIRQTPLVCWTFMICNTYPWRVDKVYHSFHPADLAVAPIAAWCLQSHHNSRSGPGSERGATPTNTGTNIIKSEKKNELFRRLKIHKIFTCVLRFYIEDLFFIVPMVNHDILDMQFHGTTYILWPTLWCSPVQSAYYVL